jgi:ATP-dependent RNA helicase DDX31/DBP7
METKGKYQHKSKEEDPMSYHARPRDLIPQGTDRTSLDITQAKKRPRDASREIFSQVSFGSLALDERLVKALENSAQEGGLGMKVTTNVQSAVIPTMMQYRRNMIIKSQTGSGKTLAYLLPIIHDLMQRTPLIQRQDGTRALVLAPTRELCTQIHSVLTKVVRCCVWIVGGCLSGGEKKKSEKARLRKGISILVATPGRLLDHLKTTESFSLTNLEWVILDEADRLLDMGKLSKLISAP